MHIERSAGHMQWFRKVTFLPDKGNVSLFIYFILLSGLSISHVVLQGKALKDSSFNYKSITMGENVTIACKSVNQLPGLKVPFCHISTGYEQT